MTPIEGNRASGPPSGGGRSLPAPLAWYGLALALLGLAVGLFAGLSLSPVVGVLLPLLFSLLGGAGGLYLVRADLGREAERRRLGLVGLMLALFLALTIGGALYGLLVRTGSGLAALLPGVAGQAPAPVAAALDTAELDAAAALELAALRYRLDALGASPGEQASILAAARRDVGTPLTRSAFARSFEGLRTRADQVAAVVAEAGARDGAAPAGLRDVQRFVRLKAEQYGFLARELGRRSVPPAELAKLLEDDRRIYFELVRGGGFGDASLADWLLAHPEVRRKLWEMELAYAEAYHGALELGWLSGQPLAEAIDRLLAGPGASASPGGDAISRARAQTGFAP